MQSCRSGGCGAPPEAPSGASVAPSRITAAPSAADGTKVEACADGNCEIAVSSPIDIRLTGQGDLTTLSVVTVDPDGLRVTTTSTAGQGSAELVRGCTVRIYSGGGGMSCGGKQDPPPPEVLAMQLVSVANGIAVLRLISGEPGPPPSSVVPRLPTAPRPTF